MGRVSGLLGLLGHRGQIHHHLSDGLRDRERFRPFGFGPNTLRLHNALMSNSNYDVSGPEAATTARYDSKTPPRRRTTAWLHKPTRLRRKFIIRLSNGLPDRQLATAPAPWTHDAPNKVADRSL